MTQMNFKHLARNVFKKSTIAEIIALLYVCLMLYTAISKLRDYDITREQMAMMPLLTPFAHVIVWLLPVAEIIISILLFLPPTRNAGLYIVTGLMISFTVYIIYMMSNYAHLPCSCGGIMEALSWKGHLIFNIVFIILGIIAISLFKGASRQQLKEYATGLR